MKKQIIYSTIILLMGLKLQAQVVLSDKNYVHTTVPQTAMTIAEMENVNCSNINDIDRAIESVTYFDGLGRPIQQRAIKASRDGKDIVTHIEYDAYGRQVKQYLPFEATNTVGSYKDVDINIDINQYYKDTYASDFPGITDLNQINAYSENLFDGSPLNRVIKVGAPGTAWKANPSSDADHAIKTDWYTNKVNEVIYFKVDFANPGNTEAPSLVTDGHYAENQLYITITQDENWTPADGNNHTTKEYKDKQGRIVLKRTFNAGSAHDTHYVYDRFGNLTYVISPKATASDGISETELTELCYQYHYDNRNRLIKKKVPGKDWEYIVYNKLDQPILTQDANLKAGNAWLFTKYDAFGRVVYTGKVTIPNKTREELQIEATAYIGKLWSERGVAVMIGGVPMYYNDGGYPKTITGEVLTIQYYDNYDMPALLQGNVLPQDLNSFGVAVDLNAKGQPTVSQTKVLETSLWITSAVAYDKKGRAIATAARNEYLKTTDVTELLLDFTGKVEKSKTTHIKDNNPPIVTLDTFTYDHMGRMISQNQCIGDGTLANSCGDSGSSNPPIEFNTPTTDTQTIEASNITLLPGFSFVATTSTTFSAIATGSGANDPNAEQIVFNTYDNLGQLKSKKIGGGLQDVAYDYNVRGWLTAINKGNTDDGSLFGFKINYNTPQHGATALFNGNISETEWKTASVNPNPPNNLVSNKYVYAYDALNRIVSATDNTGHYNLSGITYDKVGNILSLNRKGHINAAATVFGDMDMLSYTYDSGNKLMKVTDAAPIDQFGFKDDAVNSTADTSDDYVYDTNGNMTQDQNKGITGITYNHLNLPKTVTINNADHTGNITYIYDATGAKLKKIATEGSSLTTEYSGNYIYKDGVLEFFNHPEGYVEKEADGYKYVYQYKDHLGNIRLSYKDANKDGTITTSEIIEEKNYYPFGMLHSGYNFAVNGSKHNYGFGGKEEQSELGLEWLDFSARNYDPTLGRWMNLDPLSENYSATSPYVYALNNPMAFIDPDGRDVKNADEERKKQAQKELKTNQNIVASAESKYGTKKGSFKNKSQYKRYKKAKRNVNKSQRSVAKYTRRSKTTQKRIDNFKKNSPKMFAAMDNIQNQYGQTVDVMVGVGNISSKGYNGYNEYSFDTNSKGEVRQKTQEFGMNTVNIMLNENSVMGQGLGGGTPTTLEVTKHEMGHANYEIQNAKSFQTYLNNLKKSAKGKEGHNSGNPSGNNATLWEGLKDIK